MNFAMSFYRLYFTSEFEHCSRHVCVEYAYILGKVRISLRHEIYLVCFSVFFLFVWFNFSSVFRTNESSSDLLVYNRFCWFLWLSHIKIDYIYNAHRVNKRIEYLLNDLHRCLKIELQNNRDESTQRHSKVFVN